VRIKRWFYTSLVVIAVAEILVPRLFHPDHAHFRFEDLPAWGSGYGLLVCRDHQSLEAPGKLGLMRAENYYEP
jgi:hypothetical protein